MKIGLGTVQFGLDYGISNTTGITPDNEVKEILDLALIKGINTIDTAYGYGKSEAVLGQNGADRFKIISKFLPENGDLTVEKQIMTSLERLRVKTLYGLLAHRPIDVAEHPEIWDYLIELRNRGTVKKVGFSFNFPDEIETVLKKKMIPDIIQVPFNYFDNRFASKMKELKSNGCEIHTRSAFLQGLFFANISGLPDFFNEVKPLIRTMQQKKNELPALLLHHCICQPFIDTVIVGINNINQLKNNLRPIKPDSVLPALQHNISSEILTPSLWPK